MSTPIPGVLILQPERLRDGRGFFTETYNKKRLEQAGIFVEFVQDNLSFNVNRFILRGLHFQVEPFAQAKLVSVIKGSALDVVVDLRRDSPRFGQHFALELNAAEGKQLFVPAGLAHGFLTREPDTLFAYKVSQYYSPGHERGIRFDDASLGIDWGVAPQLIAASHKDQEWPGFDPQAEYFP